MCSRELLELRAIVKGDVQGIGFRAAVKRGADQLELVGFTRNLSDGSVEICAIGSKADLEKLLSKLLEIFKQNIEEISKDFHAVSQTYSSFLVK